jgi:hypothetical protein
VKLDRGKSKDDLLALPEKKPQAYEKNRRLLGEHTQENHAQNGLESFHRYLHT